MSQIANRIFEIVQKFTQALHANANDSHTIKIMNTEIKNSLVRISFIYCSFVVIDAHERCLQLKTPDLNDHSPRNTCYSILSEISHARYTRQPSVRTLIPTTWPAYMRTPARAVEPMVACAANKLLLADTLAYDCVVQFPPDRKKGLESGMVCVLVVTLVLNTSVCLLSIVGRMNRSSKKKDLEGKQVCLTHHYQRRGDLPHTHTPTMTTTKAHEESEPRQQWCVPTISIWYEAAAATVVFNSAASDIMRRERNMLERTLVLYVKFDVLFINDATLATVDRVNGSRSIVSMNWNNAHSECGTLCKYVWMYMSVDCARARAFIHNVVHTGNVEMSSASSQHSTTSRTEEYQIIIIIDRARPSTEWLNIWIWR